MEPELKGIVIISLPPVDDPSQGKTISAITFSHNHPNPQNHHVPCPPNPNPISSPSPPPPSSSSSSSLMTSPLSFLPSRKALTILVGFTLIASSIWAYLFSEHPIRFLEDKSERERRQHNSFWLPLHPKCRRREENSTCLLEMANVKLETSVNYRVGVQTIKSASSTSSNHSSVIVPLRGNVFPDGQYYTSIFIGNPPRPYFLDVDTGSDLTWIQCDAPCSSCAKGPHPLYKPTKGKIVAPKDSLCLDVQRNMNVKYCDSCQQCDYEIEYADRSSSMGVLARDDMHLVVANGDTTKLDFVFGCAYDQQGQLLASPAKTDGILGLSTAKVSLPSQLMHQGIINNVIGHCITNDVDGGGYMFFGDDFVPRWGMTWVPAISILTNFYQAEVLKLGYGDQQISIGRHGNIMGRVVFDTGSSYTYFPREAYANLITSLDSTITNLVRDHSDQTLQVCWRADYPLRSVNDVKQFFQPLTLQFGNRWLILSTKFDIPPEAYLIISAKGNVCLGILDGSDVHDGSAIILGDNSLRGKMIVYDNIQQRIGWSTSICDKPRRRIKEFPFFFR